MAKLLCTADLHLGRRSSLPDQHGGLELYAAAVWRRIADVALAERVTAVLIAGDLMDDDHARYEATGPFERELRRLAEADIPCYVVAGNHDHAALQRIAATPGLSHLRWLGQQGQWEEVLLAGEVEVAIHGWSFPAAHCAESPLASYPYPRQPGRFTIGLVHADLGQPGSRYAPVTEQELAAHPYVFWLLGHVHGRREVAAGERTVALYPGSPQALDLNEPGPHGVYLLELGPAGRTALEFVPLSTVRYERPEIDLTGCDEQSVEEAVLAALDELVTTTAAAGEPLRWLCCRPRLVGETTLCARLEVLLEPLRALSREVGGVTLLLDGWTDLTRPALETSLEKLADGNHPPAVLARLLLGLQSGEEPELVEAAAAALQVIHGRYPEPGDPPGTAQQARERLVVQGYRLLAALQRQQEAEHVAV